MKGWKFPIQVDEQSGKIKTVEDRENIKQDVLVILKTQTNERRIFENFGANLRSFMFDVVNPPFINSLKNRVSSSLREWEAHIDDINVAVKTEGGSAAKVEAIVDYTTTLESIQERVVEKIEVQGK